MSVPLCLAVVQTGVLLRLLMNYAQTDGTCEHITDNKILIFSNTHRYLAQRMSLEI